MKKRLDRADIVETPIGFTSKVGNKLQGPGRKALFSQDSGQKVSMRADSAPRIIIFESLRDPSHVTARRCAQLHGNG